VNNRVTCPECGAEPDLYKGINIIPITTPDDRDLGLVRYALRCEACGFATAFIAKKYDHPCPNCEGYGCSLCQENP